MIEQIFIVVSDTLDINDYISSATNKSVASIRSLMQFTEIIVL